jgi:hypothetical protein
MQHITLHVGTAELEVQLDTARAPGLASALLRSLPHASLAVHCLVAGAEFCVPVPFFHWHENRCIPKAGDVGYASFGNYLCLYYGDMAPDDGPTNIVGRVSSSTSALESLGERLLTQGAQRAHIATGTASNAPSRSLASLSDKSRLAGLSRSLLETTLASPPIDVVHLMRAHLPAMGNVAGRMQASVLLLALAECLMNARTLALQASSSFPTVLASIATQLERYARWLAMAGLHGIAAWLDSARDALRLEPLRADEFARGVEEALVAIARLRFWVEAFCPWHKVQGDYYRTESAWMNFVPTAGNKDSP